MPTNVVFAPDSTLYANIILNGGTGAPIDLADGELYIDEAARLLYVETVAGIQPIPLDVSYVPRRPSGLPPDYVLIKTPTGSEWGPLMGGAGGQPFDASEYRVPGLAPASLGTLVLPAASDGQAIFEMAAQDVLLTLRVYAESGSGLVTFKLYTYDGQVGTLLMTQPVTFAGPGEEVIPVSLDLAPGYYVWTWESTATMTLSTVDGNLSWTTTAQTHPVAMKF